MEIALNIAIVDDNPTDTARLRSFIRTWHESSSPLTLSTASYPSGEDMMRVFVPGSLQLVFMDILMGGTNGVDTARQIRRLDSEVLIVFLTTSRDFAFEAFPVHPFDYIIKPCTKKNVAGVLDEALRFLNAYDPKITLRLPHSVMTIPARLIASAVSRSHTVELTLTDGQTLTSNMTFREVERELSQHSSFLLCNRGIILNMSQISAMKDGTFIMKDGAVFPIRVNGQAKVRDAFSQYLITNMKAEVLKGE